MQYCYILKSIKNNKYYIGSTSNISNRLHIHNLGKVKSTKPHRPWQLIYKGKYSTLKEARGREGQIKSWHSRSAIERLINKASSSRG